MKESDFASESVCWEGVGAVHSTWRNSVLENSLQGERQPPRKRRLFQKARAPLKAAGELDPFRAQGALHPKLIRRQHSLGWTEVTSSPLHAQAVTVHHGSVPSCA